MRFQGLVFASIAKTSDAMVGHKASRSKGARSLAKAFYSGSRPSPTRRTGPSDRPNLSASPAKISASSSCNGNVRLDRSVRRRQRTGGEERGAGGPDARLKPARHCRELEHDADQSRPYSTPSPVFG